MMNINPGLGNALLNSASDAIIATDHDGRITFWNPGAERMFGFTAEETVGQSLDLIIPENLRARHWSGYRNTMKTGTSRYGHGDLLSVPGLDKGRPAHLGRIHHRAVAKRRSRRIGTVAVMRDVTKRSRKSGN